jgi:hypothetical protein
MDPLWAVAVAARGIPERCRTVLGRRTATSSCCSPVDRGDPHPAGDCFVNLVGDGDPNTIPGGLHTHEARLFDANSLIDSAMAAYPWSPSVMTDVQMTAT